MAGTTTGVAKEEFVYRVSTAEEWEEIQKTGSTLGGDLDRRTGCIHLSDLRQVKMVLNNFYPGRKDLCLLQVDAAKLGEGLVYEAVDESNSFPHFYGPSRSFSPLPLDVVTRAEKLELVNEQFNCSS
ncbi:putative Pre-mRNA-splicing factor SYF2 [Cocos nucifera]|uniref:Putative Pre-mRNA-splicing factor SYF2 n=1 Tax=Cocos nucifera TaxID=13894 RepID=A0A8K0I787_COCNU|nr:putative Pre-mRNA-splicing factor SYF2 [Cocos nucifera]